MTNMEADFDKQALEDIWTQSGWRCIVTNSQGVTTGWLNWKIVDADHIIGRNKDDKVYSSVYNCCPILRQIHSQFQNVNNRWFRMFQLERVKEVVQTAIREGRYEETDNDVAFLHEVLPEWESVNFPKDL